MLLGIHHTGRCSDKEAGHLMPFIETPVVAARKSFAYCSFCTPEPNGTAWRPRLGLTPPTVPATGTPSGPSEVLPIGGHVRHPIAHGF